MRSIGHLAEESAARTFSDYLYVQRIDNQIDHDPPHGWAIWITEEDQIPRATAFLSEFRQNPADPKYTSEAKAAADLRAQKNQETKAYLKKVHGRGTVFAPLTSYGFGPLTFALIVISTAVFILSKFGNSPESVMSLSITEYEIDGEYMRWAGGLPEIMHGQVWRLFTPIFVHYSILHILFNMLWLRDLGSMIEGRQSSWFLGIQVLLMAAASNLAQYYIGHAPSFGGMSGVIYGLLGYVWIRGKYDPASGLFLHQSTAVMMLIWFGAGWTGILGPVANYAHAGGFVVGLAWGYLASLRRH